MLAVSCSRKESETEFAGIEHDGLNYICLEASLPEDTKAHIQESEASLASVVWDDDDVMAVYDGVAIRDFKIKEGTNTGKTAVFEGYVSSSASEFLLAYPSRPRCRAMRMVLYCHSLPSSTQGALYATSRR